MKNISFHRYILISLLLCLTSLYLYLSIDKGNDSNTILKFESTKSHFAIDYKLLDSIDKSNQKTIELSSIMFDVMKDVKTLQLLVKIRKNHEKIKTNVNTLAKNNLIIIPQFSYHANLCTDSIKGKKGDLYLLKTLQKELDNQIRLFTKIENTTSNIDFKIVSTQANKSIQLNNSTLTNLIKDLK